jgi:hypothetical protein
MNFFSPSTLKVTARERTRGFEHLIQFSKN